jgi:hypothetical protein
MTVGPFVVPRKPAKYGVERGLRFRCSILRSAQTQVPIAHRLCRCSASRAIEADALRGRRHHSNSPMGAITDFCRPRPATPFQLAGVRLAASVDFC